MHFCLYLYLGALGVLELSCDFDSFIRCMEHGNAEVAKFRAVHKHSPAFAWCVKDAPAGTPD